MLGCVALSSPVSRAENSRPSFMKMIVGTPRSESFFMISRFSARFIFKKSIRSPYLAASSAIFGASARQGAQLGSQISSTTGLFAEASDTSGS